MNKIATLFHPKIYGGTMLLTLNSSFIICNQIPLPSENTKRVFGLVIDFGDWDVPKSITRPKIRLWQNGPRTRMMS